MNNRGFTLLEILISLIIIAVLILAVNKVVYTVKKINYKNENIYDSSVYAQNILEYLKSETVNLTEGEFKPEEVINKDISSFLSNEKFSDTLIKINKIYKNDELEKVIFEVKLLISWEGVSDVQNYKIATYISQK